MEKNKKCLECSETQEYEKKFSEIFVRVSAKTWNKGPLTFLKFCLITIINRPHQHGPSCRPSCAGKGKGLSGM